MGGSHRLPSRHRLGLPGDRSGWSCWAGPSPCPSCCWRRPDFALPGPVHPAPRPIWRAMPHNPEAGASCPARPAQSRQPGGHACSAPWSASPDPAGYAPDGGSWRRASSPCSSAAVGAAQTPGGQPEPPQRHLAPVGDILHASALHGVHPARGQLPDPVPPALSGLPAHIQSLPDATHLLGGVFTLSAVIGVLLQLPASRLVERRLGVPLAMGLGA